jgi:hypothetical protein
MKSPTENLLNAVDRFLRKTGMPPSIFGSQAVGDPNLVKDLRDGRELRHRTLLRVKTFMDSYDDSARESA